jgi:hypothetical protein
MIFIVAHFALDKFINDDTACDPDCQSRNVDERIAFVAEQIAQRDFEIVLEHV